MQQPFALKRFALMQLGFWLAVGVALFLYGLGYGHWHVAFIRNLYNPLVGLLCSSLAAFVLHALLPRPKTPQLALFALLVTIMTAVTLAVVNPLTYLLLGYNLGDLPPQLWLTDGLYFLLIYILWSLLYIRWFLDDIIPAETSKPYTDAIQIRDRQELLTLRLTDVLYIQASGDYAEFHTDTRAYMKKQTLSSLEKELDPELFVRVHRSLIINRTAVTKVTPLAKGQVQLALKDGQELVASRAYRDAALALAPKAE